MSRTRYRIFETEYPYFLTCTVVGWLPIFTRPEAVEIVLDSLRFLQSERELNLFGYVIMENHLHMVASAPELSKVIKDFKSFTARQLIDLLESRSAETMLSQLRAHKLPHKRESSYQFWQEGSHPQQIQNENTMRQKLEYIHYNPVKRGYVDETEHWRYSSARNYAGREGLIEVIKDWR